MGSAARPILDEGNIEGTPGESTQGIFGPGTTTPRQPGLPAGKELLDDVLNEIRNGLPANVRARIEKQGRGNIAGGLRSAENRLNRTFATEGNVPIGAKSDAIAGLQNQSNKGLNDLYMNLDNMDLDARNRAFQKYGDLIRLALGRSQTVNDARLKSYEIDKENEFDIGNAIGSLFGGAGNILSGLASGGYL